MLNYIGARCPVCDKRFAQTDDIVVCPICGAPHHRDCYAQKDECAFAEEHLSGKEWRPPEPEPKSEPGAGNSGEESFSGQAGQTHLKSCARCGSANPKDSLFCQICGSRFIGGSGFDGAANTGIRTERANPSGSDAFPGYGIFNIDPLGGVGADEKIADIPVPDLMLFIGPGSAYYIPRFYAAEKTGRRISSNFSAFFFSFLYYFYRKMYSIGAVLLGIYAAGLVPFFLFVKELIPKLIYPYESISVPDILNDRAISFYAELAWLVWGTLIAASLLLSFFANYIYYKKTIKQVGKLFRQKRESAGGSFHDYHRALNLAGGVNRIGVFLLAAGIFVGTSVIYSVIVYLNTGGAA